MAHLCGGVSFRMQFTQGVQVQGDRPISRMPRAHCCVVIDIDEQDQQSPPTKNAFAGLMSPTSAKLVNHPAPSSSKGDSNNARISIYKQLCKLMKASDGLYVETLNNKTDLAALT